MATATATATTLVSTSPNLCGGLSHSPHTLIVRGSTAARPSGLHLSSMATRGYNLEPMFSSSVLLPLSLSTRRERSCRFTLRAKSSPDGADESRESLDITVFRFTLGIPGFDDADLPRVVGILFGGFFILNHAFSLSSLTDAQLRTEAIGLVLAAVCIALPSIGRQLNKPNERKQPLPGQKQIFSLADGLTDRQKQEFAWVSYNLLRNTTTIAMLVWHSEQVVGARGFWGAPKDIDAGTSQPLEWLQGSLSAKADDFLTLQEPLYLPASADSRGWDFVPEGAASVLVQPFSNDKSSEKNSSTEGFLLAISNTEYGYRRKDRYWTTALARKLSDVLNV